MYDEKITINNPTPKTVDTTIVGVNANPIRIVKNQQPANTTIAAIKETHRPITKLSSP